MVLHSKFAYGSQFSGEKNDLKIRYLVAEILGKLGCSFFGTTCTKQNKKSTTTILTTSTTTKEPQYNRN